MQPKYARFVCIWLERLKTMLKNKSSLDNKSNERTTAHNATKEIRESEDWQQTRGNVATLLGSMSSQAQCDMIITVIPKNSTEALDQAKRGIIIGAPSTDQTADSIADATILIKKSENHNLVSLNNPDTPTKGDQYAPWQ